MAAVCRLLISRWLCQGQQAALAAPAQWSHGFSTATDPAPKPQKEYQFVVVGAGTGGMAMTNALTRKYGKGKVAVVEPQENHFYQPMWTMVGGGIKKKEQSKRLTASLLPAGVDWYQDKIASFDPDNNTVVTSKGDVLKYDLLVVAVGLKLDIPAIKGLQEALNNDPMVCCNYSYEYVDKTYEALKNFKKGNAIFTQPNSPIKCAGAPQKIMYLAHDYFKKNGKLQDANIIFNQGLPKIFSALKYASVLTDICVSRGITVNLQANLVEVRHSKKEAVFQKLDKETPEFVTYQNGKSQDAMVIFNQGLPKVFGVEKYAKVLTEICKSKGITVNLQTNLVEVRHDKREAVFQKLDKEAPEYVTYEYEMMHAVPHMGPPEVLKSSPLAGPAGFMTVNKLTGQHTKYPNVVGLGDCTDIPTSKTAAAAAGQVGMLKTTIQAITHGHDPEKVSKYDGYTSCPLVTGYSTCVLAEFDFDLQPLETFPFDQGKERRSMYIMKRDMMPQLYWLMMAKGRWHGPGWVRRLLHLGFSK